MNLEEGAAFIVNKIQSHKPFFVGKIGTSELDVLIFYTHYRQDAQRRAYPQNIKLNIARNGGLFPATDLAMDAWAKHMLTEVLPACDGFAAWNEGWGGPPPGPVLAESQNGSPGVSSRRFDLIVSNPPYIPSAEIAALEPEVRDFDPQAALDGGVDGLDFYRLIALQAAAFLKPEGKVMVEFGDGQAGAIRKIFETEKWIVEAVKEDYSQRARILIARL